MLRELLVRLLHISSKGLRSQAAGTSSSWSQHISVWWSSWIVELHCLTQWMVPRVTVLRVRPYQNHDKSSNGQKEHHSQPLCVTNPLTCMTLRQPPMTLLVYSKAINVLSSPSQQQGEVWRTTLQQPVHDLWVPVCGFWCCQQRTVLGHLYLSAQVYQLPPTLVVRARWPMESFLCWEFIRECKQAVCLNLFFFFSASSSVWHQCCIITFKGEFGLNWRGTVDVEMLLAKIGR